MSSRSTAAKGSAVLSSHERQGLDNERTVVRDGLLRLMREGDSRYLIPEGWYAKWTKYVGMGGYNHSRGDPDLHPGEVDLSCLKDENGKLRSGLVEQHDYRVVPEDTWKIITAKYGTSDKCPDPICRPIVLTRNKNNLNVEVVELYPVRILARLYSDLSDCRKLNFARIVTIGEVDQSLRKEYEIDENIESRLWYLNCNNKMKLIEPVKMSSITLAKSIEEKVLNSPVQLIFEIRQKCDDLQWHCPNANILGELSEIFGSNVSFFHSD